MIALWMHYFSTRYSTDFTLAPSGVLILTLSMVVAKPIFRQHRIRGLTVGALKEADP